MSSYNDLIYIIFNTKEICMYLFEKINDLLKFYNYSRIMLAKKIDVPTATFNRYFTPDQEDKLRACLWKIHQIFPEISRDWLFFDEGEMFEKKENIQLIKLQKENEELKQENSEINKMNRQLQAELIEERKISRELQAKLDNTLNNTSSVQKTLSA